MREIQVTRMGISQNSRRFPIVGDNSKSSTRLTIDSHARIISHLSMGRLDLSTRFAVACICTSVPLTAQSDIDNDVIMNKKRYFNRVIMVVKNVEFG